MIEILQRICLPASLVAFLAAPAFAQTEEERPLIYQTVDITRASAEHEWPFAADAGKLACVVLEEHHWVFFTENPNLEGVTSLEDIREPRTVVVTTNPFGFIASFEDRSLYLPWDSLETLVKRLAPWERMGRTLCQTALQAQPTNDSPQPAK